MVHQASALRIRKKTQQTELATSFTSFTLLAEAEDIKPLGLDQSPEIYNASATPAPWEDTKDKKTEARKEASLEKVRWCM